LSIKSLLQIDKIILEEYIPIVYLLPGREFPHSGRSRSLHRISAGKSKLGGNRKV